MSLKIHLSEKNLTYDGNQLSAHWIYSSFEILGNALVAFHGPAEVPIEHMVDCVDVKNRAPIYSPQMLHFVGEWFFDSLEVGILLQNRLVGIVYEALWELGVVDLRRTGNDIYWKGKKLSVSIATRSGVSVLMHLGVNIRTEGTPIPTSGLEELGIEPKSFAQRVLEKFKADWEQWRVARVKVSAR